MHACLYLNSTVNRNLVSNNGRPVDMQGPIERIPIKARCIIVTNQCHYATNDTDFSFSLAYATKYGKEKDLWILKVNHAESS